MAAAWRAYPSDEEERTAPMSATPQWEPARQALTHRQPLHDGNDLTAQTPDRLIASRADERRRIFRRRNDDTACGFPVEFPAEDRSAPPSAAAPLTPQPCRTRSEGAAADVMSASSQLPVIRSAPRPNRARARTYSNHSPCSNGKCSGRDDEEEWEARRAIAAGGQHRAASAPDWDGLFRTPPRRVRSRTIDTPSCSSLDVEQGTPVRRTASCDDEVLQQATSPQLRRMTDRVATHEASSGPHLPSCRGWAFSYGRNARTLVCVGLYLILMTLDQTGIMNSPVKQHQYESDFGKEIHFNGMRMAIDNDHIITEANNAESADMKSETVAGSDPLDRKLPINPKTTTGKKTVAKVQHARGKKKRRPVVAQARSLGFENRPVFVPKVEPPLQTHGLSNGGDDGHSHTKSVHEIRTFSLSEEDLKAPLPEELLPPEYEAGPSATLKVLTLSAWICLTILVLETGCGEIRRRFQYVNLRQLRSHREDRSM
uniref:Uncharacterized protein n=1 Tax=Odontella aurita TaxID=265563 RepID=A0A7S4N1T1_9STRA